MPAPFRMNRRALLRSGAAAAAFALGASLRSAHAQPPPRAVAHHRFALGQREVIVLSDGHLEFPAGFLAGNVSESDVRSFLAARDLGPDRIQFHINVALIKTGDDYTLIDAGSGGTWEPTAGKLADSLDAAGIAPDRIGTVIITHAHPITSGASSTSLTTACAFRAPAISSPRASSTSGPAARPHA